MPLGEATKAIKTPYFIRTGPAISVSATGVTYAAASKAKRVNILSELKATNYGVKVKGEEHNLKVKANTYVSINGTVALRNKEVIDLKKQGANEVKVWQQATGKKPATKLQTVELPS